jgi:uncharacterized protein YraI
MKKIATFTIVLLLLFSMAMPAFADLGDSDFDNWSVVTGPSGFSFVDVPYYDTPENADLHDYLKPGTKLWVHSYDTESKKYLLTIDGESGHKIKGAGHVLVTEAQLDKYFVGEKEAYSPKYTTKLDKKVECVVTPSVGVVLRQGPGTGYPSFKVIPQNTKLTYRYVYEGEKYNWGYVTYKGQDGWCCIDYTEKIEATTEATSAEPETTTETTTEATTEATTEITTEQTTAATTETTGPEESTKDVLAETIEAADEAQSFFGSTKNVILVCCAGAVILALTAVVILVILKKKKTV